MKGGRYYCESGHNNEGRKNVAHVEVLLSESLLIDADAVVFIFMKYFAHVSAIKCAPEMVAERTKMFVILPVRVQDFPNPPCI